MESPHIGLSGYPRHWLSRRDIRDLLLLVGAAFVILPWLPDRNIDPWDSLNPRRLWTLVVAIMAISSGGYLALRVFGARFGLTVAGLAGGFASSTATIVAMGGRARDDPAWAPAAASAAVMSNVGTTVQLAIVIGSLAPTLLIRLSVPLTVAGTTAVVCAGLVSWRSWHALGHLRSLGKWRPFDRWSALRFVALVAGIVLVSAFIRHYAGDASVPWLVVPAALADVHAAAASVAQATASGQLGETFAAWCVLLAFATNAVFKCILAWTKGGPAYGRRVIPSIAAVVAVFAVALALTSTMPLNPR